MKTSFIILAGAAVVLAQQTSAPIPTVTAAAGSLPLGAACSTSEQCSNGASCYATNSMLIPACGNFQATCKDDSQCAFNTCNQGFCNGFKASSSSSAAASATSTTTTGAPIPTVTAAAGSLPLGASCSTSEQCSNGANCYAVNSMLIPVCGNFQATCKDDSQCAFNTCNQGFCNGFKASSSSSAAASSTSTATSSGAPLPTVTAAAGSLPVGSTCSNSSQCADGANCYAVNSGLIPVCGNFQATCSRDSQCAYNTCVGGFCAGFKPSGSASSIPKPTYSMIRNGTTSAAATPSASITPSTGGAMPASGIASGLLAIVFTALAWVL